MKIPKIVNKIYYYFNLESELDDFDKIHESIVKDVVFKGTNLWILMFAIIVASVGLNMNSTAVIIGAMLISPLMGPINGIGYSIATYNYHLFRKSIKNFSFAVGASLFASTTYFLLSPISTAHSELLARTSPTIYDVLIALFGGAAGIIAISSKQKGNVIPGVAIATALMPPLCTAGYGLATGQFYYFLGALYLFTINTVFIALAALVVSQVLKYPIRTIVEPSLKIKVNRIITGIILIVLLPSIYFGYQLVQLEKFNDKANKYISNISIFEGNYLLDSKVEPDQRTIKLVYGGMDLSKDQKNTISNKVYDFDLKNVKVIIDQGLTFERSDDKETELLKLRHELDRSFEKLKVKEMKIDSLTESISMKGNFGKTLLNEIRSLYPQLSSCAFAETLIFYDSLPVPKATKIVFFTVNEKDPKLEEIETIRIENWLKSRLNTEDLIVLYKDSSVED